MTREEARTDLMLAQADISYRPKDDSIDMAIEALNNQKIGHWKETTLANGRKGMECSSCGCEPIEDTLYGYVYSDYCPNCGAKMKQGGVYNGKEN